jgi:hypothetical protein
MAGVVGGKINVGFPKVSHGWSNQAMPPALEGRFTVKAGKSCHQLSAVAGPWKATPINTKRSNIYGSYNI